MRGKQVRKDCLKGGLSRQSMAIANCSGNPLQYRRRLSGWYAAKEISGERCVHRAARVFLFGVLCTPVPRLEKKYSQGGFLFRERLVVGFWQAGGAWLS